jgi:hypothetical protein
MVPIYDLLTVLRDFSKSMGNCCRIGTMEADFGKLFSSSRKGGAVILLKTTHHLFAKA